MDVIVARRELSRGQEGQEGQEGRVGSGDLRWSVKTSHEC